ncbi:MAG: hypothetical protein L0K86_06520, partial [Actinomycetia bacterium]|nr:hypothetical protein [Actinomycetes bacterium]
IDALIGGIGTSMLGVILLAWFLASILGDLLSGAGLVSGLVWAALQVGITAPWFPLIVFAVACLLSVSTGTALGTIFAVTPVLFPAGFAIGGDPYLLVGAIVGGAFFGNNIAPVSDTTIVSAYTQGATVPKVVRTRLPYAGVALAITVAVYVLVALMGGSDDGVAEMPADAGPRPLIMLLVPAMLVALMLAGRHFVEALLYSIVAGIVVALVAGLLEPSALFSVDSDAMQASGILIDGISGTVGVVVFTILLMGLIGTVQRGGVIEWLLEKTQGLTTTTRRAELTLIGVVLIVNALVAAGTPAMVMAGDFVRRIGHRAGITPWRRANLFDAASTTLVAFLPYSVALLIPYSIVAEQVAATGGYNHFSAATLAPFVFYCWALLAVIIVAAITGWRREFSTSDELAAEQLELDAATSRTG